MQILAITSIPIVWHAHTHALAPSNKWKRVLPQSPLVLTKLMEAHLNEPKQLGSGDYHRRRLRRAIRHRLESGSHPQADLRMRWQTIMRAKQLANRIPGRLSKAPLREKAPAMRQEW